MIDVDAGGEQERNRLDVGTLAGRDQRVAAEPVADRQIRLPGQHHRDDLGASACAGEEPRRVEVSGLRVHARACLEERLRDLDMVRVDSEKKRRAALSVARVDGGAGGEQAAYLLQIARSGRL